MLGINAQTGQPLVGIDHLRQSIRDIGSVRISVCEALRDFSTAADGACDVPADAVGKSVVILRDAFGESSVAARV